MELINERDIKDIIYHGKELTLSAAIQMAHFKGNYWPHWHIVLEYVEARENCYEAHR